VLDGDRVGAQPPQHAAPPHFRSMCIVAKRSPISATVELLLHNFASSIFQRAACRAFQTCILYSHYKTTSCGNMVTFCWNPYSSFDTGNMQVLIFCELGLKTPKKLECFPKKGSWVRRLTCHNVAWTEAYLRTKWHPDLSSRLATIDMGRGLYGQGLLCPQSRGSGGLLCPFPWGTPVLI